MTPDELVSALMSSEPERTALAAQVAVDVLRVIHPVITAAASALAAGVVVPEGWPAPTMEVDGEILISDDGVKWRTILGETSPSGVEWSVSGSPTYHAAVQDAADEAVATMLRADSPLF